MCHHTNFAVAGQENARSSESSRQACFTRKNAVLKHHDLSPSVQQRFFAYTKARVIAFQQAGNPFDEDSHEVSIIDTREYGT